MYLLFDFDGTLADTQNAVIDYFASKYPRIRFEQFKTKGLANMLRQYRISPWQATIATYFMKRALHARMKDIHSFPRMKETLRELAKNHELGIVSSNSRKNIRTFLHKEELWHYFRFVHADSSLFGKDRVLTRMLRHHHIDPKEAIYIGDEDRDIIAAKKVGMRVIAVSWGFNDEKLLKKQGPNFIVRSPEEMVKVARQLRTLKAVRQ